MIHNIQSRLERVKREEHSSARFALDNTSDKNL